MSSSKTSKITVTYVTLPNWEINLYFVVWLSSIAYAVYQVYKFSDDYFGENFEDRYNDFGEGWRWLNRKKDISDTEWRIGTSYLLKLVPWYLTHHIVSELLHSQHHLEVWHAILGSMFIMYSFGIVTLLVLWTQPVLFYLTNGTRRGTWMCGVCILVTVNCLSLLEGCLHDDHERQHVVMVIVAWVTLRCLNYSLDTASAQGNLLQLLGYCFYLPVLLQGPLVLYTDYARIFSRGKQRWNRYPRAALGYVRCVGWGILTELLLHYVYVNALTYQSSGLAHMDAWALYGLGYCMGQFFHLKYIVFYGVGVHLGLLDGAHVPPAPRCIAHIHKYSDMWRHFDVGLYQFLSRYIYRPMLSADGNLISKLCASAMCFSFVCVWHGAYDYVVIWSMLNWLGVSIESLFGALWVRTYWPLGLKMRRRVECLVASPLFAMSALSNFYFFAGKQVGDLYVIRFLFDSNWVVFFVLLVLYCGSQVSVEIELYRTCKKMKGKQIESNKPYEKKIGLCN